MYFLEFYNFSERVARAKRPRWQKGLFVFVSYCTWKQNLVLYYCNAEVAQW